MMCSALLSVGSCVCTSITKDSNSLVIMGFSLGFSRLTLHVVTAVTPLDNLWVDNGTWPARRAQTSEKQKDL